MLLAALLAAGCASGDTDPAVQVTYKAATLVGHGSPGGESTDYWFQYGKTTGYGNTTPHRDGGSGTATTGVSERVTGLDPDTTYHYRACASNRSGSGCGKDVTFRTGSDGLLPGFQETTVFDGLNAPIAVRFAPDGRIFVAEKRGVIKVFDGPNDTTATVFADLRTKVYNYWDRGFTGLAIDPSFPARPYVYALYAHDAAIGGTAPRWGSPGVDTDDCPDPPGPTTNGCVISGRLSRLTAQGDQQVGAEQVLIEDWCQQYPSHSTGDLQFGSDGSLYVSGGDGGSFDFVDYGQFGIPKNPCGDPGAAVGGTQTPPTSEGGALRSQDLRTSGDPAGLSGALLRVDPATGAALPTNPSASSSDPNVRRIVAYGFRNPFRFGIRTMSYGDEVWVGDVGWNTWEEIDRVAQPLINAIEDFGWPCYEGNSRQPGYDAADLSLCENLYASGDALPPYALTYNHWDKVNDEDDCGLGSSSISGMTFPPTTTTWPAEFAGSAFFADYARGCIWAMERSPTTGNPDNHFIRLLQAHAGTPVDLEFGPGGDLYYVDILGGTVKRLHYSQGNQAPKAVAAASPTNGDTPLTVSFNGSGSSDPDGDAISYAWDLDGDGDYDDSTAVSPSYTYSARGSYAVGLRVKDPAGVTATDTVAITAGNTPPTAAIATPSPGLSWKVAQSIAFSGGATDRQDGTLPASALSWSVTLQHCPSNCHSHPIRDFPNVASGSFAAPDHEYPSYLELKLTATDSGGLTDTRTIRLDPRTVNLSLRSNPSGLKLAVGAQQQTTPFVCTVIEGSANTVSAVTPQTLAGKTYDFGSWSDGGLGTHTITANAAATYTASYNQR